LRSGTAVVQEGVEVEDVWVEREVVVWVAIGKVE
jgi:hypothetical protein